MFKNYELINPDCENLMDSIVKSGENLEDIDDKVRGYKIDYHNQHGKILSQMFKDNLLLAKQVFFLLILF